MSEILDELNAWQNGLKALKFSEIFKNGSEKVVFISVDMINGFCCEGALASKRVGELASRIADTFRLAREKFDLKNYILIQDAHEPNSAEFASFPAHALKGDTQAEAVDELRNLDFFDEMKTFYKNSLSIAYSQEFNKFISKFDSFVIMGDCTDMCVYQLVSHLRLSANEQNLKREIIVPANLVQTYDALGHSGDFYQNVFLHHMQMALNARVVKELEF